MSFDKDEASRHRINSFEFRGNYTATSHNMKLVHWSLMGGLLHLIQPTESPPGCTKCKSLCSKYQTAVAADKQAQVPQM